MKFEERSSAFQNEVEQLQRKYGLQMYACYALLQNGEMTSLIKLRNLLPEEQVLEQKKYDDSTEKRPSNNKKA